MIGPVSEGMRLFKSRSSVAVVGYSENPHRVVVKITKYLVSEGNTVTGVNPALDKAEKIDIPVVAKLADLEKPVDIIQIFRNSSALPELAQEILELSWKPRMVWCQQGVFSIPFQECLERHGIPVVMDACPYALRTFL